MPRAMHGDCCTSNFACCMLTAPQPSGAEYPLSAIRRIVCMMFAAHRWLDVSAACCMVRVPCVCMHSVPICSGRRPASGTLLRNAQVEATEADEATEFPPEVRSAPPLPSSHAIDALACCACHARPLEPLPLRSCTHTRTYQLCGTHQGAYACGRVRWYVYPAAHPASVAQAHMY